MFCFEKLCVKSIQIESFSGPYFPVFRQFLDSENFDSESEAYLHCTKNEIFHQGFGYIY